MCYAELQDDERSSRLAIGSVYQCDHPVAQGQLPTSDILIDGATKSTTAFRCGFPS